MEAAHRNIEPVYSVMDGPDTYRMIQDEDRKLFSSRRIRYLDPQETMREKHIIAKVKNKIVGMAGIQINPRETDDLWIKFISVDPEFQGRGIAKQLLYRVYQFASQQGLKMAPGGFTEEGERLRHLHDIWDAEFPEVAYARDERGNYVNDSGVIMRSADR